MAVSLFFNSSTNSTMNITATANGYTKKANLDENNTAWGSWQSTGSTDLWQGRSCERTLYIYGPIQYNFIFYANGYQKSIVNNGSNVTVTRTIYFDPNDGKSYNISVTVQPISALTIYKQTWSQSRTRGSNTAAWGNWTGSPGGRIKQSDSTYSYTASTDSITAFTAPTRFFWNGNILSGQVVQENLYANDWIRLANTAYKKANWRYQRDQGSWNYSVNVWSGKEVSASDYNTMAGYCECYTRVNSGDLIYASTILALSNAVNNGL